MQFRTEIPIHNNKYPIDYNSKIMSIGSCFAVNMAQKLDFKFQNSCNLWDFVSSLAIENSYFASENKLQKKMYFFITNAGIVLMYIIVMLIKTIYYITGMRLLQQQSDK
jgi:hypothetical protein